MSLDEGLVLFCYDIFLTQVISISYLCFCNSWYNHFYHSRANKFRKLMVANVTDWHSLLSPLVGSIEQNPILTFQRPKWISLNRPLTALLRKHCCKNAWLKCYPPLQVWFDLADRAGFKPICPISSNRAPRYAY